LLEPKERHLETAAIHVKTVLVVIITMQCIHIISKITLIITVNKKGTFYLIYSTKSTAVHNSCKFQDLPN